MNVSILIPTHNRCELLGRTLDSLAMVRIPGGVDVELVVVANVCTDATEATVAGRAATMPFPTRCVAEAKIGLNPARNRCVRESRGQILALLDDDVLVDPGWLEGLLEVYDRHPADMVAGRIHLWWEAVARPEWMTPWIEAMLSANDRGDDIRELVSWGDAVGANFSFRREVYDQIGGFTDGLDRTGAQLLSGGEGEFVLRAMARGKRLFYAPRAAVKHWVPAHRVQDKYLGDLAFGMGQSHVFLKPRLGLAQLARLVAGRSWLIAWGGMGQTLATLRRDRSSAVRNRMLRLIGLGGLQGALLRMRGKSPIGPRR